MITHALVWASKKMGAIVDWMERDDDADHTIGCAVFVALGILGWGAVALAINIVRAAWRALS